jgi:hypothetical protein
MALRISNLLFALLFAFSVVVQANDPDPLRWMAIYGAATAACVAWDRLSLPRGVAALIGGLALAWALSVALSLHLEPLDRHPRIRYPTRGESDSRWAITYPTDRP